MLTPFQLDPAKLRLGVPEMDAEHQTLIELMNRLFELAAEKAPKEQLAKTCNDLIFFTQRHFADEEQYMLEIGYPYLSAHQIIHADLLRALLLHSSEFKAGPGVVTEDCIMFMKTWLWKHIMGVDTDYATFARQQGRTQAPGLSILQGIFQAQGLKA